MLYTVPIFLVGVMVITVVTTPAVESWLGLAVSLLLAALALPRAWSRVSLAEDHLTLHTPLRQSRTVYLRQLIAVERSPRLGHALLLRYHPMDERGRLDLANHEFLGLIPVDQQSLLEERLQAIVG